MMYKQLITLALCYSIKPALLTATPTLLYSGSQHMHMNTSVHFIILLEIVADKMMDKHNNKLGLRSSIEPVLLTATAKLLCSIS